MEDMSIAIRDHISTDLSDIRLRIEVSDDLLGHLVEAGLDGFKVYEDRRELEISNDDNPIISVFPNPATHRLIIEPKERLAQISSVEIFSLNGQRISFQRQGENVLDLAGFSPSIYILRVELDNGTVSTSKLVITK